MRLFKGDPSYQRGDSYCFVTVQENGVNTLTLKYPDLAHESYSFYHCLFNRVVEFVEQHSIGENSENPDVFILVVKTNVKLVDLQGGVS